MSPEQTPKKNPVQDVKSSPLDELKRSLALIQSSQPESQGSVDESSSKKQEVKGEGQAAPELVSPSGRGASETFLIVGLGNPGKDYAHTRHNIGFMVVDRLASRLGVTFSRLQHRAMVTDARYYDHRLILAKPQTYMNESGQAVVPLLNFYKVPLSNLLVAFDDMDLPLGAIRIRPKGGSGGQKGMKSIIARLGGEQEFPRLRLGLGRPPGRMDPVGFLLQEIPKAERALLDPVLDRGVDAILVFVRFGLLTAMNQYNQSGEIKE